jgi:acetyl esterase/lipase
MRWLFLFVFVLLGHSQEPTAEKLRNRPILSQPIIGDKLIIAHHMTGFVAWDGAPDGLARVFEPVPAGEASDVVGTRSIVPMGGMVEEPAVADLDTAVRRELVAAKQTGIDGFQFFFPIHMHDGFLRRYSQIVRRFIRQAEVEHPDFRVSLCLCAPTSPASEPEMRAQWAEHIRWILADSADSPIWLRTPDGRLLFYTWVPEGLVDALRGPKATHIHAPAGIAATAVAYEKLARAIGEDIAFIFHVRGRADEGMAHLIYDYFPAAWRWAEGDMSADSLRLVELARKRQRLFSPTVYPSFIGHIYKGDEAGNGSGKVGRDPIDQLWRPYHKTQQTRLFRKQLQASIASDAKLLSVVTWNDFTENTQVMPDVNANFAWGVLLNHYKNIWLGQGEKNREFAALAIKKHRLDQLVDKDVGLRVINEGDFGDLADESQMELLTFLKSPATLLVDKRVSGELKTGFTSLLFPFRAAAIDVRVRRNGRDVFVLRPSEQGTTQPRRNDPASVMLSSEQHRYFKAIFGNATPYRLREYATGPSPDLDYKLAVNIPYRPDGDLYSQRRCRLDVYYPRERKGFATIVWFHGGGLKAGERTVPKALRDQGVAIVPVDYRLHPQIKSPTYVEDAAASVAWTLRNIANYGGDPEQVYVSGHSAGGYLTSMIGLDKRWLRAHDIDADRIAGLIPFSGHTITHFTVRRERGIDGKQPIVDDMAPLFHVRKDAPPLLLITGDREREMLGRYEENAYLWRMMKVVGHPDVHLREVQGFDHGGMAEPAFSLLLDFVRKQAAQ